jgi:hypothetical protein
MVLAVDRDRVFPDDIIRILLNSAFEESTETSFKFSDEDLHILIFEAKKKNPELFKEFNFRVNGTYPYSQLIERIIHRAKISRLIKTSNPDYSEIQLKDESKIYVEKNLQPKFKKNELDILKDLGKKLKFSSNTASS